MRFRRHIICAIGALALLATTLVAHGPQSADAAADGEECAGVTGALLLAPFDSNYDCRSLGAVPGVPDRYGGIAISSSDPDTLVMGGGANSAAGRLYKIRLKRDGGGHVTGFDGEAVLYGSDSPPPVNGGATAQTAIGYDNDGGVTFGPGGLLFNTLFPDNLLAQSRPGEDAPAKVIDLSKLNIVSSVGAVFFVPEGFPGAGSMKIASYNASRWYSVEYEEDSAGTYDLKSATMDVQFDGGPEGITHVPQGSKSFPRDSILIALYQKGTVITVPLDANGNPRMDDARDVISGLTGAEGAVIDPKTGDFLFSTFGGGNHLVRVTGFASPGGVAEAYRPSMVRAVPSLADISTEPDVIATNVTLALVTLLFIFIAAQLLNSTISENKDEIDALLAPVSGPLRAITSRIPASRPAALPASSNLIAGLKWPVLILGLTVLIYGFTDPGFGLNGRSAVLALSLLITVGLVTYLTEGGEAHLARTRFGQETGVRPFPIAIVIAVANVILCRAIGFAPGVIYGFVGAAVFLRPSTLTPRESAHIVFLPAIAMLGVSIIAWLLVVPLRAAADAWDSPLPAFFEGIAVTLFVTGLQGTFFNMVPLSFMDGQKIWRWNKLAWAGLTVTTALLFWHVLINGDQSYLQALSSTVSAAAFGILTAALVASMGAWLYFHRRRQARSDGA